MNNITNEVERVKSEWKAKIPTRQMNEATAAAVALLRDFKAKAQTLVEQIKQVESEIAPMREWINRDVNELVTQQDKLLGAVEDAETKHHTMMTKKRPPLPSEAEKKEAHAALQRAVAESERNLVELLHVATAHYPELLEQEILRDCDATIDCFKPGRWLSHYEDEKQLKVTSRHPVFAATWEGRKVILKQYSSREEDMKRMKREIRLLKFLQHENIARVTAFFIEKSRAFVEMPFYAGGTVDRWFDERRAALLQSNKCGAELVRITSELLAALDHLHTRHVVHCDVKPDNVFVHENGHIVLGDFDISKSSDQRSLTIVSDLRTMTNVAGTIAFAAPELLDGRAARATSASDIYAAALVICELIEPNFAATRPHDAARLSASREAAGHAELIKLLQLMLGEAGNRPTAAQVLKHQALAGTAQNRSAITVPLYWSSLDETTPRRIDVTAELGALVEAMMNKSSVWSNPNNTNDVRLDRDDSRNVIALGLNNDKDRHRGYAVVKVERIENHRVWRKFSETQRDISEKLAALNVFNAVQFECLAGLCACVACALTEKHRLAS
jgi:serine/threonine protein kinase